MQSRPTGVRFLPQGILDRVAYLTMPQADYKLSFSKSAPNPKTISRFKSNGFPIRMLDLTITGSGVAKQLPRNFWYDLRYAKDTVATLIPALEQSYTEISADVPTHSVLLEIVP